MTKTYISDLTHYLDDTGDLKETTRAVRRRAEFQIAIVDAVTWKCPSVGSNTGVRCLARGCKGTIPASLHTANSNITWWCPICEQLGVISNWQGTKWDHTKDAKPGKPNYTPKEGQYLAFIYYYTKLNRQAPAELDMQRYFQASPPTVHSMVVRLEKHGFIERVPGKPRSIRLLLTREQLPDLE